MQRHLQATTHRPTHLCNDIDVMKRTTKLHACILHETLTETEKRDQR